MENLTDNERKFLLRVLVGTLETWDDAKRHETEPEFRGQITEDIGTLEDILRKLGWERTMAPTFLVATLGRHQLFRDNERNCFFINRDGDLIVDSIAKEQVVDAWFEAVSYEGE